MLAVGFSGAGFGSAVGCIALLLNFTIDNVEATNVEALLLIPIAAIFGGLLALVFAVPSVGLLTAIFTFLVPSRGWTRTRICWFASIGGGASGILSIVLPTWFELRAVGFSLVSGFFGGFLTFLVMLFLTRGLPPISSPSTPLSIPTDAI